MKGIAGIVLSGGASSRFRRDKALSPFLSGTLLDAVIQRVKPQVSLLAINVSYVKASAYQRRYGDRFPLVIDNFPKGTGPLSGIAAGLTWLEALGGQWLATFPCDTPFLPSNLVTQLMEIADSVPVAARDEKRLQGVCAVWPVSCGEKLRNAVKAGTLRSIHEALEALAGRTRLITGDENAFYNVNTTDDLATAEALARQSA